MPTNHFTEFGVVKAATVKAWLDGARTGTCGATIDNDRGDCVHGSFGSFGLSSAATASWEAATADCLAQCGHCSRCRYISTSLRWRDCSWYAQCAALSREVSDVRSAPLTPNATWSHARHTCPPPAAIDDKAWDALYKGEQLVVSHDHALHRRSVWPRCGRSLRSASSDVIWQQLCAPPLQCIFLRHADRRVFALLLQHAHQERHEWLQGAIHEARRKKLLLDSENLNELSSLAAHSGGDGSQTLQSGPASVEVGVWQGRFSHFLLTQLASDFNRRNRRARARGRGKWASLSSCARHTHYLVDPYQHYPCDPSMRDKHCRHGQPFFDALYINVTRTFADAPYGRCVRHMRNTSIDAAQAMLAARGPRSLSFAYIDARHDHDGVLADLAAWWPLMRRGSLLGGHDLTTPMVARAVRDSVLAHGEAQAARPLFITRDHPASWALFVA